MSINKINTILLSNKIILISNYYLNKFYYNTIIKLHRNDAN